MRVAACWVADFPLAALVRSFPELAEEPLAVAAGPKPQDKLVAVSGQAQELGVFPGMTAAQARQVAGAVLVRTVPQGVEAAAMAALQDVARSFSPKVKAVEPGLLWLEVGGWGREEDFARALWQRCFRVGLGVRVGVAGSGAVATVAARTGELVVVPQGEEVRFLAPLPLELASPSPACRDTLASWGIATFGQLAALPRGEVGRRLGKEGLALHRLAQGEGEPFLPDPVEEGFREGVWLEEPISSLESCLFVLQGILGRLRERLLLRGVGFAQARIELCLENKEKRTYLLPLLAPTSDVPALLALARLLLAASPPGAAVEGVVVEAQGGAVPSLQDSLFGPPRPHPMSLATTLVRLAALVGPDNVGRAALLDSHRPSAWRLAPFALPREQAPPSLAKGEGGTPVLRLWHPPRPAQVTAVGGKPVAVRLAEGGGVVRAWAGPYRSQGEWWGDAPFSRDDYDVLLASGVVLRIFYDHQQKRWFADGIYD